MNTKGWKTFRKILLWFVGIWAILLAVLQIALSDSVLTGIVNSLADNFFTEEVDFGKVSASVLKNFPNLNVTVDDVAVTYPHDKFEAFDTTCFYGKLMEKGRAETVDTLVSVRKLSASVNLMSLAFKKIRVPQLILDRPRVFAKTYCDTVANWNVFRTSDEKEESDSTGFPFTSVSIGKVALSGRPSIVFCNARDTLCASLRLKDAVLKGQISTKGERGKVSLDIDSLNIAGRLASDTLLFSLPSLRIYEHSNHLDLKASARAFIANGSLGRIGIPMEIVSHIEPIRDSILGVRISETAISLANIPVRADAEVLYLKDSIYVKGDASIDECKVSDVLNYFSKSNLNILKDIRTDAAIDMSARYDGFYRLSGGRMPRMDLVLTIPSSALSLTGTDVKGRLALELKMNCSEDGMFDVRIPEAFADVFGASVSLSGTATDLLGKDPVFIFKAGASADLDSLALILAKDSGIKAVGRADAGLEGTITMSQLDLYRFAEANLNGFIRCRQMDMESPSDTVSFHIDNLDASLSTKKNTSVSGLEKGRRMMSLKASIDSLSADIKGSMIVKGRKLALDAWNDAAVISGRGSAKSVIYPVSGHLSAASLSLRDAEAYAVAMVRTDNTFTLSPSKNDRSIPKLDIKSSNGRIFYRDSYNRVGVTDVVFVADAVNMKKTRQTRMNAFKDSLATVYPDVPKDSLFKYVMSRRKAPEIEEWMVEKDFREKDINISLGESLMNYYRDWNFNGDLDFAKASVVSPYFPLKTTLGNFCGKVSNNEIDLESFSLTSGSSSLSASGKLSGLRRGLLRNGIMNLDLKVQSDSLNVNELLAALAKGSEFSGDDLSTDLDDDDYEKQVVTDTLAAVKVESPLIVIPANLNANIILNAKQVDYSSMRLQKAQSEIAMRERCLSLTKTYAMSDIGYLTFDGFYSTRSKKDLKAGFAVNMVGVTAEKVIEMIPAVDSILPMLKSFKGSLDCNLAATASIDTNMNIVMPSIDGVMKIHGRKLSVENSEGFTKIANLLKFNNSSSGYIDEMSVEGLISDNTLEIFPFVIDIDRYKLALSGIQNMDQSFRYHISIIESPMVFKFGVDLYGNDFNDFKFKIGKALYKSGNVPVFTAVVDQTRLNLTESIKNVFRKGVDEAIRENNSHDLINKQREELDYRADAQMDTLNASEVVDSSIFQSSTLIR